MFYKEPGFAQTNWHSDLRMAPFDTNDFITAWIPLRPIAGGTKKQQEQEGSSRAGSAGGAGPSGRGGSSSRDKQGGGGLKAAEKDSGLLFAVGSHRDFALPFWHEMEGRDLGDRNYQLKDTGGWDMCLCSHRTTRAPPRVLML